MNFKIVVSDPKTKRAYQKEFDQKQSGLLGRKLKDTLKGEALGLPSYELEITGGSDKEGFPMRRDVEGAARKKILLAFPPGFHPLKKGQRKRKSIRGNTVSVDTAQINTKIAKYGPKTIEELWGVTPKEPKKKPAKEAEKPKEEAPKEAAEKPKEAAKHEHKEEAPKEKHAEKHEHKEEKPAKDQAAKAEAKMGVKSLEEVESGE